MPACILQLEIEVNRHTKCVLTDGSFEVKGKRKLIIPTHLVCEMPMDKCESLNVEFCTTLTARSVK